MEMSGPKVSIVVTSYVPESKPYLDQCMKSIANLSYKNTETILVARPDYLPEYDGAKTISPPESEFLNGRGINYGVENSSGDYLFILNDDVILTKHCVQPLMRPGANTMPISNDQQGRYGLYVGAEPKMDNSHVLVNMRSIYEPGVFVADTLCLYAHMVSRELWNKVGPMDDNAGLIDIDWSLRVRQAGFLNVIELSSLVWHYGGVSVEKTLDGPKRVKQKDQFQAKWGWRP